MGKKKKLYVFISLDVEEEGLFGGRYEVRDTKVSNVQLLPRLGPLWKDFKLPCTLFCSHSVFTSPQALKTLDWMRQNAEAEIGAHLHHWSTPPFDGHVDKNAQPIRTHLLSGELLKARLQNLLMAGADYLGKPLISFRMGRWDLKSSLFPLLLEHGIEIDSSICPLRSFHGGADHFLAPVKPYLIDANMGKKLLEVPITQIPIHAKLSRLWHKLWDREKYAGMRDRFHFFGALSANPLWHGSMVMRWATRLHSWRNGQILSLFWHSSEMLPGASPHIPNQQAADALLAKIFSFCEWLKNNFEVHGVTASQIPLLAEELAFPTLKLEKGRDW